MSFHQNGSRRYGHVPPVQWSSTGGSGQESSQGPRSQSSFENGDGASTHDTRSGRRQGPPTPLQPMSRSGSTAQQGQDLRSPTYDPYGSTSPALSGFQHQYQPVQAGAASPTTSGIVYNPQQFARTQSQSQAHAPPAPYSPQLSSSASVNRGAHAPYNPAAYQSQSSMQRQPTNSGYGYGIGGTYASSTLPQPPHSPISRQQNSTYSSISSRPSSRQTYETPLQSPQYPTSSSAPLPPRQSPYTPPSTFPSNGSPYPSDDYRSPTSVQPQYSAHPSPERSSGGPNGFSSRVSASSAQSYQQMPSPPVQQHNAAAGHQRHPTLRPLPNAPIDDDTYDILDSYSNRDDSEEELAQERAYHDIEASLGDSGSRTNQRRGLNIQGDLLDGELHRYNSTATTLDTTGGHHHSSAADHEPEYDFDDYESDAEAAAGLEAMRIAEEQDALRGVGSFGVFGSQRTSKAPSRELSREASSDSDYGNVDMGLYGGGYDAHLSYGADDPAALSADHQSEMADQSRPLPNVNDFRRSEGHDPPAGLGGIEQYAMPGESSLHPFPAFGPARVDTYGTGGLQRPGSHGRKLSFDDGDEIGSIDSNRADSRLSTRSGSESPLKDDIPEMFYHPGMSAGGQRPLPVLPTADNRTPVLMPAGSYRNSYPDQLSHGQDSDTPGGSLYSSHGSESYLPQLASNSGGQYVPRSTSLNSHSSTPVTVPPVRSKTDAEERQARQRLQKQQMALRSGGTLESYENGTPQSSMGLDLPVLPKGRKKFNPAKLSSSDFKKCTEPWAMSGIAAWLKEMGGGETGEGEADLREKTITEALVALFTHKVSTMNTADAELLSDRTVKSMFDAGVLCRDEEWVKFGQGDICGVMWQLTGSGCYSPKLHEQEMPGRCYSYHCHRTLKKINLQAQALEPARKAEDWVTFFGLKKEQLEGVPKKEVERQNNLHEIVMSEDVFMDQLNVLRVLYRDALKAWQPPIVAANRIQKFTNNVFGKVEAVKKANEDHLLAQLKYRQQEQGPWVVGFSDIFREWIRKARSAYIEYAAGFPHATYLVRKEADRNILFRQFLDQARDHKLSGRLDWNTYLKAPITRLQRYSLLLATVHKNMKQDSEEKVNLAKAIDEIKHVTLECDAKVDEMTKKVEMMEMSSKLILRPGMERVELNLDHLGRELIFKGDLQRVGANRFTWLETHAILFDHYLVLAKTVANRDSGLGGRKNERYDVSKLPIPMQLLVLESTDDDPVVKSSVKGLGAVTTVTRNAAPSPAEQRTGRSNTMQGVALEPTTTNASTASNGSISRVVTTTNLEQDAKSMYPFRVKHLGKSEVYTLYAPTAKNRTAWCDKILEAKTRYAASLFRQNAEPFRLRVMADSAFAYDAMSAATRTIGISVSGTPLDRAIEEVGDVYGRGGPRPAPVCRAMVNCATAFTAYGRKMVAIGTDYGVYTTEASNPRGWVRSIMSNRVTQIAVLEEFSICLIIADRSLIAYHLDVVVPPSDFPAPQHDSARRAPQKLSGARDVSFFATARMKDRTLVFYKKRESLHSVFKVLEPVFQKSSEKKSRIFGKKFGGTTEFFREFDEFYIPTECFTINLFNTYIAISTQRGFELLTLDKKVPMSIPDLKSPEISSIAARLAGQKPLGMFRLSDQEYLLCYEECGVYIDKHGDVSRSVVLEFVGKAKTAAMYGAYLVLFDSDFVEVRNAENGRLRQVVAGRDVRCLDYGLSVGGQGTERTLKVAMAHPEYAGSQLVLEMVLNEGQRD